MFQTKSHSGWLDNCKIQIEFEGLKRLTHSVRSYLANTKRHALTILTVIVLYSKYNTHEYNINEIWRGENGF